MTENKKTNEKKTSSKTKATQKRSRKPKKPKVKLSREKTILLAGIIFAVFIILMASTIALSSRKPASQAAEKPSKKYELPTSKPAEKKAKAQKKEASRSKTVADSMQQTMPENAKSPEKKASPSKESKPVQKTSSPKASSGESGKKNESGSKTSSSSKNAPVLQKTPAQKDSSSSNPSSSKSTSATQAPQAAKTNQEVPQAKKIPEPFPIPPAVNGAAISFVFDDGGQNLNHLQKFLELDFPLTIAVLPKLQHSKESGRRVRLSGKQLILHQPMQALNEKANPGPGAIKPEMHVAEIMNLVRENIAEIGPVAGINNHEGSKICENQIQIGAVLEEVIAEKIFFLDSRTTSQTRAPQAAMERGIEIFERDIFLDNEKTRENILKELEKGVKIANKKGHAILIGHVWSADILPQILNEVVPLLKQKGYKIKTL